MSSNPLLDKMQSVVSDFNLIYSRRRQQQFSNIQKVIEDYRESKKTWKRCDFNSFSLLNVERDELRQSRFIAWLLDSSQNHGQGSIFLRAFFSACGIVIDEQCLDKDYTVRLEVSDVEARIDILAYQAGQFIIFIENKVDAGEQEKQTDREYNDLISMAARLDIKKHIYAVFLTPDGRGPISGNADKWIPLSYSDLKKSIRICLPDDIPIKLKYFLEDWFGSYPSIA